MQNNRSDVLQDEDGPADQPGTSPPVQPPPRLSTGTLAVILVGIGALYFGRDIFLPFALAVLLSFLLAPPVSWLRRIGLPRVAAVVLVVAAAVGMIGGISVMVVSQAVNIAANLPAYQKTMQQKIRSIRSLAPGGGTLDRTSQVIQALGEELSTEKEGTTANGRKAGRTKKEPLPVRVVPPNHEPLTRAQAVIGPLLGPIGTAGLVIIFIFFVLLEPSDLRDRFIRLAGSDLHRTTEALSEAAQRVSRYLVMQLVVNATYGIPLGIGLYLIGVPGAFLWALLATLLRFIPYLGPVIAAIFPLTLAFVVDPGWNMLLWTAGLVITMELISNNVIEPWLYGSSTGLTPVAVILAAIFWTLLWGPVGLMLATPLTVCLVVMGRYVPQLQFLDILLGSDPVLLPEERLYQRLIAGDVEEAVEIAESHVAENSLLEFYNRVGVPALRLAETSRLQGPGADDRKKVAEGIALVVADLREQEDGIGLPAAAANPTPQVLCIGGRGDLDKAGAAMLAHCLESRNIAVRQLPPSAVSLDAIPRIDLSGIEVACLVYFGSRPQSYARYVCRRLKRRMPHLKIVLAPWNLPFDAGPPEQLAAYAGADFVATTLEATVQGVDDMVQQPMPASVPLPLPNQEQERLQAMQESGVLSASKTSHLDHIARSIADALDTPIGLVSLVDDSCQIWKGAHGLPEALDKSRQWPRDVAICTHVVTANAPLVVEDMRQDTRFADNPLVREQGLRFYAGVPLRTPSGHVIGTLCVMDMEPRGLSRRELKLLQVLADELMEELQPKSAKRHAMEEKQEPVPAASGVQPAPAGGA